MARTFRRRQQSNPIAELNVTNLIDLGFMLLVIFMIVTPLVNEEQTIPIRLPLESRTPQSKADTDQQFVTISVDGEGRYYIGNDQTPLDIDELRPRLQQYAAEPTPPIIRIRGEGNGPYQNIIRLMDALGQANLTKFNLDTQAQ